MESLRFIMEKVLTKRASAKFMQEINGNVHPRFLFSFEFIPLGFQRFPLVVESVTLRFIFKEALLQRLDTIAVTIVLRLGKLFLYGRVIPFKLFKPIEDLFFPSFKPS
jgi:hypothetical protein